MFWFDQRAGLTDREHDFLQARVWRKKQMPTFAIKSLPFTRTSMKYDCWCIFIDYFTFLLTSVTIFPINCTDRGTVQFGSRLSLAPIQDSQFTQFLALISLLFLSLYDGHWRGRERYHFFLLGWHCGVIVYGDARRAGRGDCLSARARE